MILSAESIFQVHLIIDKATLEQVSEPRFYSTLGFECIYLFIYLFNLFSERAKERERNINVWLPLAQPPPRDLAHNPGMCPDWELKQ